MNSIRKYPITAALAAANILLFLVCEWMGGSESRDVMLRMGAMSTPSSLIPSEFWRLLMSAFLHFGFAHLLNNMISLAVIGSFLETRIGHVRFLILYLGGAIAGNLASWYWYTRIQETTISAGASGAISALLGGIAVMALLRRKEMQGISFPRLFLAVILVLLPRSDANVDLAAHAGGLIGGMLLMLLLMPSLPSSASRAGLNGRYS